VSCRLPQRFVTRVRGSLFIVAQISGVTMAQETRVGGGAGIESRSGLRVSGCGDVSDWYGSTYRRMSDG
jgi:hypothetical protein